MQNVHFTPPQLATFFHVNVSTIKRWVDKGMLQASTTAGGHRRVSQEHLDHFLRTYPKFGRTSYVLQRMGRSPAITGTTWQRYYRHLERNEVRHAEAFIQQLYVGRVPLVTLLDRIIVPALRHIGDAWAAGTISIFDEHRMSFIVRRQLLRLDQFIVDERTARSPCIVLACAPNEHHEIPLQMLDLVCKANHWRTAVLGINVPLVEMERAVRVTKSALLGVSSTYSNRNAGRWMKRLTQYCTRANVQLAIGGSGWPLRLQQRTVQFFGTLQAFEVFLRRRRTSKVRSGVRNGSAQNGE